MNTDFKTDTSGLVTALTAERDQLRADLLIAENWVEHHSQHADDLISENVRLRAEVERLKEWLANPHTLHAHCLRTLTEGQIAHLFGERMTAIVNRAEKSEKLWKEFITLMEINEESDSGKEFNPNKISSCRAMDGKRLNEILVEARGITFDAPKE